jgi:hypothetical protein
MQAAGAATIATGISHAVAPAPVVDQRIRTAGVQQSVPVTCSPNANYRRVCEELSTGPSCHYLTNFGREYSCPTPTCEAGPPPELQRWCEAP